MPSTIPPVTASMLCAHLSGESCSSAAAGHRLSAIRERVTAATPSRWLDGIIVRISSAGETGGTWIGVDLLDAAETVWTWNHDDLGLAVAIGEPVALHELYDTLAIGATRVSVLRARR